MTPVRWAVVGWGVGGRVFHAPMIRSAERLELAAVVSTNPERAASAREAGFDVAADLAELVERGVEGVTITTPAGTHADLAVEALERGLHVVVDKPFATTASDARRIVAAAGPGSVLTVYQNRRWDGDLLTLVDLVARGEIGAVDRFESRIERFRPALPRWMSDRSSVAGGGVLVDLGPHLIDQAVWLFGPVTEVFADLATLGAERVSEDDAVILMRHAAGMRTMIIASVHAAAEGPRFRVSGRQGGARIDGFDGQEAALFAGESPRTLGDRWGVDPDRSVDVESRGSHEVRPLMRGRWDLFYPSVAAAVRDGAPVPVDPADAVHVAAVFDAARTSAREGRWIPVEVD